MAYPDDALAPHEKLILNLHPHAWILIKPGVPLVVLVLVGLWEKIAVDNVVLSALLALAILVNVGWFLNRFFYWLTSHFVLTSDRVMYRGGILEKQSIEIPLERINTVFCHQGLFERMLRLGDLEIESASKDGAQRFDDIRRPADVQKEIYVQMENNENRKYDRMGAATHGGSAPAPAAAAPSIADQINQLATLRDQGHLTEAEFQAKKSELLGRM
jgi:uncharacterized membrane protein YdbT with pleckstrin-like domain